MRAAALIALAAALVAAAAARSASAPFDRPSRVAVLVLENRSYDEVIGNPQAPYLNALARRYALATSYYAIGHPSLPNYIALIGGSTFEIRSDCNGCDVEARSLVGQLDAAGLSWKAYFEDLTSNRRPGARTAAYDPHYNPFVYYEGIRSSVLGRSRVVDFDELRSDLRRRTLPRFCGLRRVCGTTGTRARCARPTGSRRASCRGSCARSARTASSSSPGTRARAATGGGSTACAAAATSR